ncbi:ATP-dependent DNA ligase [Streptomyces spectabilis]|uniref:ATP-dependent DNA ligase n=1 Tax=Streptomyces spectabilis TaxID=68270 RepID=A0A5P2X661_STRST|nr:ATP-dependent DNA ligase [Streptomyces spectabilis]MBB5108259.1 ATP-dependent DNA ligase [Streptomyces spectabilis]MCI3901020.1 ATP-dependent DNA ligase [Streptomyces spectabilis]QEV58520.1 ATP-dependent DNA ligase [Streptomyces spectabilis]GGV45515.1 DNA ligase [Streptomyces spectabilis]
MLPFPVRVALAEPVTDLPHGEYAFEWKLDGHRLLLASTEVGPLVQAGRSGRNITGLFPDLAAVAERLEVGTVLDGEGVVHNDGRIDFGAMQSRALAAPRRAADLAHRLPAHFVAFDVIVDRGQDRRGWPYHRRRALLEDLVAPIGPPLQVVPMTRDRAQALAWLADEDLAAAGVEGVLAKPWTQAYPGGRRGWLKLRPSAPRDAVAVGYTGRARAPARLIIDFGDHLALSTPLSVELRHHLAQALQASTSRRPETARLEDGTEYWQLPQPLSVEVDHGTTRHAATTVRRLRPDLAD